MEKKNVNCYCTQQTQDDFYILCDYCSEWCHGICHSIQPQDCSKIHLWACPTCISFGKETILLNVCISCPNHVVYKSKYCNKCGEQVNYPRLKRIISIRQEKKYKTVANQKYLKDVYTYDLQDEVEKLNQEKELVLKELEKVQDKLSRIDDIVDKVYKSNLNKSPRDMICGFHYEILVCDFHIQQVQIVLNAEPEQQMENVYETQSESVCQTVGKCWKHSGWQKLKTLETEIQLQELVYSFFLII
jgi:hypothetical protein